jgi:hypothetical protein
VLGKLARDGVRIERWTFAREQWRGFESAPGRSEGFIEHWGRRQVPLGRGLAGPRVMRRLGADVMRSRL